MLLGGSSYWIIVNTNQNVIQRFLALRSKNSARNSSWIYVVGITTLIGMCIYNGLVLYATYFDCDPLTTKLAKAKDQLVPLLVMQTLKDIPGLPGLFIAGVFSGKQICGEDVSILTINLIKAALSSLSSGLNSMSAIVLEDYFKPFMKNELSERATSLIMRGTVLVLGALAVAMVYVVQHLGSVLQLSMSVPATCTGSVFGVFVIGMFVPWIGKRAVFYGALSASSVMIYIVARSQLDMMNGLLKYDTKITSIEGCSYNFSSLDPPTHHDAVPMEKEFHHVSYLYYMPLGALLTCMSAFILSFIFGFEDPNNVDLNLLAPCVRKYFNSRRDNLDVQAEMKEMTIAFDKKGYPIKLTN